MEISNLSEAELKTLVRRMLTKFSGYFNSMKKIQSEMRETVIEIKTNSQVINSRVDEAKNRIDDLEYKEAKDFQSAQQEEKRILKN